MWSLSIIVPTLNEADLIAKTLLRLQPYRHKGHQVIVADGGSVDDTVALAGRLADEVVVSQRGRGRQMNRGAARASGEVLVFLHSDTWLPPNADVLVCGLASAGRVWGRFDVRLSGAHPVFRVIEAFMNLRSRVTGIATGDQAMFVRRDLFEALGGFPDIDLMEDVVMSRKLKRHGRPLCLVPMVVTSSRRWEQRGVVRTVVLMWCLRLAHALGADPKLLARLYEGERGSPS